MIEQAVCIAGGGNAAHALDDPAGQVEGTPAVISKEASDVIPGADVILMPLPSFAHPGILSGVKEHLRKGQTICVTPGQGKHVLMF